MGRKKKNSASAVKQKNNNSDSGVKQQKKKNIFDSGVKQQKKKNIFDSAVKQKKKKNDEVNDDECKGGISCHQCLHHHRPNEAIKCRVFKCKLSYGVSCLMRKYPGEDFMVKGWICPRCRGMCNCKKCLQVCNKCMKLIVQQNALEDLDVEEELNTTISSLKKKQEESNTIICKLEANVSSLKASLAHEESQNLVLEREQGSLREELQRIKDSNSSLLQHIQLQNEHLKHLSLSRRSFEDDEVIMPSTSDSFVEAEALKQKVQELNATISNLETTISSLKASLANEEAQKLEAKEARKVIEKELHSVREVFQRVLASPKVKFTAEEPLRSIMGHKLRRIMDYKHNIRNITVIAQASQGKSSLTDALVAATAAAGIIAQDTAGDVRMTDTGISLYHHMTDEALKSFKGERNGNNYVINLIDSPAALCITDGALVVVDCIEGVCVQTETVLHQALVERVRPVLTVNNMDRCFLELQVDGERAYHIFKRVIKTVNVIMATYKDPLCGDVMVYPEKGTVAFSSGLHGWSFTLTNFAKMYAGKFGVDESKMMERLWGDNFFDPKTKKWTKEDTGAATCKRGFVQFCYDPIKHIINTCMNDEQDVLWPLLANLGVTMKSEEKELMGKPLMKRVMQNWLPAATALLEMVIFHLPSPHTAQRYRVENLYDGPLDDPYANAIKNCDRDGPVMLHVSKMIPAASGRFFAFGRVFAGTVSAGMKVRIRGPNFVPGEKKDLLYLYVKSVAIWMGKKQETVEDVPCGNTLSIMLSRIKEEEKSGGENLIAGLCLKDIEEDLTVDLSVENKFVDLQDRLCGIQARLLKELRMGSESIKQEVKFYSEELTQFGVKIQGLVEDSAKKYSAVLTENRKLYNQVQDLKGSSATKQSRQFF